jgi:peptidoglycan hydrolase-like protein with peptidoglycan-binding domain
MKPRFLLLAAVTATAFGAPAIAQQQQDFSPQVVQRAEQALKEMKFVAGPVDGRMDPMTHYGIRQFQRSQNLAITGGLNMETLAAMGIEASEYPASARRGSPRIGAQQDYSREVVRKVEQALHEMNLVAGPVDGIIDPQTRFGLHRFQASQDLATTGSLNMETLAALGIEADEYGSATGGTRQQSVQQPSAQQQSAQQQSGQQRAAQSGSSESYVVASTLYTPEIIRATEQALKDRNYAVGPVNSVIEPNTQYGLRQFQRSNGLAPTGNLNYETLSKLGIDVRQSGQ